MQLDDVADVSDQPYGPESFAEKYGLSKRLAVTMLRTNGPSRRACDAAAKTYLAYIALQRRRQDRG